MKLSFNNASIRTKILSIVALNIVFFAVIAFVVINSINQQNKEKDAILLNGKVLFHFQTADMMHDAIRADVFKLLSIDRNDKEAVGGVKTDFEEHGKNFEDNITVIENLEGVPAEIKSQITNVKPALLNYLSFSKELIELAEKNDSVSDRTLNKKSGNFQTVFDQLAVQNETLSELILANSDQVKANAEASSASLKQFIIIVIILSVLLSIALSYFISWRVQKSVLQARDTLNLLSDGNLPEQTNVSSKDEIGQMISSINILTSNLSNVKHFAEEVGKGKFDSDVSVFNNQGDLGVALDGMRKSLANVADEDNKRNWATSGIAEIGDILRANNKDLTILYNNVISFTVKYLKANQGGLFLVNDDVESDKHLELVACYAYDKRKYLEKRIEIGEGLLGQCYLEKDIIYLTDVPNKYTSITSGLGDATPNCLILSPLMVNEEINGVLEIASFTPFEPYQIEFIKRLSESIASVITSVRINERTTRLLEQTQQQSEEMRAQEEEMRQNLEELQATQEEFYRKEQDYINEIEKLKNA